MQIFRYLLIATVLDPRIKSKLFSVEKQGEVRKLLIKELKALNKSQNTVTAIPESIEPPLKIQKLSVGADRIQQLLNNSNQQQHGIEETASSKIIAVIY